MTDTPSPDPAPVSDGPRPTAAESGPESGDAAGQPVALTISRQYVKDFSFENPNAPQIYAMFSDEGPDLQFTVDMAASPLGERTHEVVVSLNVTAKQGETTAFILELQYAGLVTVGEGLAEGPLERTLMIEVPRYLFPFIRATIANATREGGFPPLLLSPIDFRQLYRERRLKAEPGAEAPPAAATA